MSLVIDKKPLVSVIVPCYNQAVFLSETLDSVLAQTLQDWECIIVNDGSPDNTEEIANRYIKKDKRFKYIYKKNGGLSSARNAGLKEAKGVFFQFLDSDDIILPTKFEKQVAQMLQDATIAISVSRYKYCSVDSNNIFEDENSKAIYQLDENGILFKWGIAFAFPPASYLVRAEFVRANQLLFNEQLKACEDWFFISQVVLRAGVLKECEENLALYRIHGNNMSANINHILTHYLICAMMLFNDMTDMQKDIYAKKYAESLLQRIQINSKNFEAERRAISYDYKIGNIVLKLPRVIMRYVRKILKKVKSMK